LKPAVRYALYYAPEHDDPLWQAGTRWLGRDPETGFDLEPPAVPDIATRTAAARRYGFHATLKAPFPLGTDEATLIAATARLAARLRPFTLPRLAVMRLEGFIALCAAEDSQALRCLAARCVIGLDRHRAGTRPDDRLNRIDGLDRRGIDYFDRYGYPHVMERFRFHLTLSDRGAPEAMFSAARDYFAASLRLTREVRALALFREDAPGADLHLIARLPMGGTTLR
jgi:2'-5' RNA ligase